MRRDASEQESAGEDGPLHDDPSTASDEPALRFPDGVALTTLMRDQTFMLMTSDAHRGLLRFAPWGEPLQPNTRKVFVVADRRFGPVKIYAQVLGPAHGELADSCIVVRWILLTATEQRRYLMDALEALLGVKTAVKEADEPLGPHRKLIYDAETQRVQLIWVEAADGLATQAPTRLAAASRRRLRTALEAQRDSRYGNSVPAPPQRKTQPRILVQLNEPSEPVSLEALEAVLSDKPSAASPGHRASNEPILRTRAPRPAKARSPSPTLTGSLGVSPGLQGMTRKRRPLYPCDDTVGQLASQPDASDAHRVVIGWIGLDGCLFTIDAKRSPELGRDVWLGLRTMNDSVLWMHGVVALITMNHAEQTSTVQLELRDEQLAQPYVALVEHWQAIDASRQDE